MTIIQNDTWYLNANNLNSIEDELDWDSMNINEQSGGKSFIHYPNIPSGYPSVAIELEKFGTFNLPKNYNSGDEDTAKRYPITYLDEENKIYKLFIPLYEYTTDTGVHVTKVITTLQNDNTHDILISDTKSVEQDCYRFKADNQNLENQNLYYIQKNTQWFNPENLCSFKEKKDKNGNTIMDMTVMENNSLYTIDLGESCNVRLTLTVEYYFYNIKLGTYNLTFNPYLLDIIKNYNIEELIPENDYRGFGVQYIPQYYDIENPRLNDDIIKHIESKDIVDDSIKYKLSPSPLKINRVSPVSPDRIREGVTEYTIKSMLAIPYSKLINNYNLKKTEEYYLYKNPVNPLDPINIDYKLTVTPKNCSIGIWAVEDKTTIIDDFTKYPEETIVKYTIFPGKLDQEIDLKIKGKYAKKKGDPKNDFLHYASNNNSDYTYEKTFNTLQDFKDEQLEKCKLASLKIQAVKCDSDTGFNYISKNQTVESVVGASNYTNKTIIIPDKDDTDTATVKVSYDCPFSANNQSDYGVIAQMNTLCKVDNIYHLGYIDDNGIIQKSNINPDNNYLLANCRSEQNLIFTENIDYEICHYADTSLYHQGLIYYKFIKPVEQEVFLDKGVYIINFNYIGRPPEIRVNGSSLQNNSSSKSLSAVIYIPNSDKIKISIIKDPHEDINIASMGLYKIYETEGTDLQNKNIQKLQEDTEIQKNKDILILSNIEDYTYLQTVYTYKENQIKCLDKVYNYTGSPQHGYQILAKKNPHYTVSQDNINTEISGSKIQIRQ